jgi:hypothetical protein
MTTIFVAESVWYARGTIASRDLSERPLNTF